MFAHIPVDASGHIRAWGPSNWTLGDMSPRVDITESEANIELDVELPGVAAQDIDITLLDDQTLVLRGTRRPKREDQKVTRFSHLTERPSGSFRRTIALPVPIDEDNVEAVLRDGLLTIDLPKREPGEKGARRIPITG